MLHPFLITGLGLLPSLIWLVFYLQEDRKHPEPLRMIVYAFVLGGLMTFFALILQILLRVALYENGVPAHSEVEIAIFSVVEEVLKFLAVFIFIRKRQEFDEPLDAMIYMIIVSLGFAAVENIASLGQYSNGVSGLIGVTTMEAVALRFFGATVLHSVSSGLLGYHWAMGIEKRKAVGWYIAVGLGVAISLHALFNYLIIKTGPGSWAIAFTVFIAFFLLADFETLKATDD